MVGSLVIQITACYNMSMSNDGFIERLKTVDLWHCAMSPVT